MIKPPVRWSLGACSSLNSSEYQFPALYIHRCCLQPGRHLLSCYSDPPAHGWTNAHLTIDGHRFCDDFVGFTSFQILEITGTDIRQLSSLELYLMILRLRYYLYQFSYNLFQASLRKLHQMLPMFLWIMKTQIKVLYK